MSGDALVLEEIIKLTEDAEERLHTAIRRLGSVSSAQIEIEQLQHALLHIERAKRLVLSRTVNQVRRVAP